MKSDFSGFRLAFPPLTIQTHSPLLSLVTDMDIDSSESPSSDQLLTAVGFDSPHGYKRVEVRCGDLTKMSLKYDLLVISTFPRDYQPTPTSLVGALENNLDFSLLEHSENPYLDFRDSLSIWVTQPVESLYFERVLCTELQDENFQLSEVFENLFAGIALLEAKGISIKSVVMPMLGTGDAKIPLDKVANTLLPACKKALLSSPSLSSVTFVERSDKKALEIDKEINRSLGRNELKFPRNEVMESLRNEILTLASQAARNHSDTELFSEIAKVFRRKDLRSFEAGVLARRLVEYVVDDIIGKNGPSPPLPGIDLYKKIENLHNRKVSMWMSSYMHLLRIFGNESAHERDDGRLPSELTENDFIISLFCLNRVLRFWLDTEREL